MTTRQAQSGDWAGWRWSSRDRWGGLVDLPEDADERPWTALRRALRRHRRGPVAVRPVGRVRAGGWCAPPTPRAESWRPRGTVLVTGGTGGLGASRPLAAADGAERLVLASRRGPAAPGRHDLRPSSTRPVSPVAVAAATSTDREACGSCWPPSRDRGAADRDRARGRRSLETACGARPRNEFAGVGAAKALAAAEPRRTARDCSLDAFVLFSSLRDLGAPGQAAYAAANAYLDALAPTGAGPRVAPRPRSPGAPGREAWSTPILVHC